MIDFQHMLEAEEHASFFRNADTLTALGGESRRLSVTMNIIYLLTFIGACFILSGPLPTDAKFTLFGVEAPAAALPQQVIALITAGMFGFYATLFASYLVLQSMIAHILVREGRESYQFFAARFDATGLWSVIVARKTVGYRSPARQMALTYAIYGVAFGVVAVHAIVVLFATAVSLKMAWQGGHTILVGMGAMSVVIVLVSSVAMLALTSWKMPYRLPDEAKSI